MKHTENFRIDVFYLTGNHTMEYFNEIGEAIRYAAKWQACGANVYIMKHVFDGNYEVWDKIF